MFNFFNYLLRALLSFANLFCIEKPYLCFWATFWNYFNFKIFEFNFPTLIFWLWFFRLQLFKFRFWFSSSMIIQYGYYYGSFNTLMILLLRLLTWWSLWTLRKYLNIFWLWKCFDFGTATLEISFRNVFFNDHSILVLP